MRFALLTGFFYVAIAILAPRQFGRNERSLIVGFLIILFIMDVVELLK